MKPLASSLMFAALSAIVLTWSVPSVSAQLTVTKVAAPPDENDVLLSYTEQWFTGNTRFRYYPAEERMFTGEIYGTDFDRVVREDVPAQAEYDNAHRVRRRDRDLGQVFTVPEGIEEPIFFKAVTLRVGGEPDANEGGAGGAKVSMQFFEVTGEGTINENGTTGQTTATGHKTRWHTTDTSAHRTDDFIEGLTFTPLRIVSGGVLPEDIGTNDYMRWEIDVHDRIRLEPGKRYAFMVGFDEPGTERGLALANFSSARWPSHDEDLYEGGHGIRRDGSDNTFEVVMFDPEDADDMAAGIASSIFPSDPAERYGISPGTLGYPDIDTYRDFVFFLETSPIPEPGTLSLLGLGGLLMLRRRRR